MSRTDDLNAWRLFASFARTGTLTAAAAALEVEPSTVSRAVSGLEKALGCDLIAHNIRPLQLTPAGKLAFKRIETILRAHDSLMNTLTEDRQSLSGKIRLSSAPGFASRQLTPLLAQFHALYPEITIEILVGCTQSDVHKGFCDIATVTGEPTLPELLYMSRGRNVYLPLASPAYIAAHGMPVTPEDLQGHLGYVYCGPVRPETKALIRGSRTAAVVYGDTVRSTDILAIRSAVINGMGIAVDLPLVQVYGDILEGRLVPILPGWFRPAMECFIVTSRNTWHSKRVRIFLEWYAQAMQQLFLSFEKAVSGIVGLPPDTAPTDRKKIYRTSEKETT